MIDLLDASGQADLETLVNPQTVEFECTGRIREAVPEAVEEGAKESLSRGECLGRLNDPVADSSQVGEDIGCLLKETFEKRLGRGMTLGLLPDGLKGFQKSGSLQKGMDELTEDRWSVLAPGQAKIREERNRFPRADAKKALNCEDLSDFGVREEGLAVIRTVLPELVAIGAEGAPAILFGEKATGVFQVLVDSAPDWAYPLQ